METCSSTSLESEVTRADLGANRNPVPVPPFPPSCQGSESKGNKKRRLPQ